MIPEKSKNIEKLNRINAFKAEAGRWAEKIKVKPRQKNKSQTPPA